MAIADYDNVDASGDAKGCALMLAAIVLGGWLIYGVYRCVLWVAT